MIGQTISHYTIVEKLGEVPIRLDFAIPMSREKRSPLVGLRIPPFSGGSCGTGL